MAFLGGGFSAPINTGVNNAQNAASKAGGGALIPGTNYTYANPNFTSGVLGPSTGSPPGGTGTIDLSGMTNFLKGNTNQDIASGKAFADQYFGNNNPQIAQIESAEQQQMKGFSQAQINAMRDQGTSQINSQVGTGIHALAGMNSANHIAGGAAAAGALPLLSNANTQEAQLANNINVANIAQQNAGLANYQSTVTGERAGDLGTTFGIAGLGAADSSGAMQYVLNNGFLNWANNDLINNPGPGSGSNGGGSGPLGAPGNSFGGMMKNGFGQPILASGNDPTGIAGGTSTILQGGNPTANTPLDPNFYKNLDTNPGDLANSNVVNPVRSVANPQNWGGFSNPFLA